MESRAKLLGHPIHQMLIVFPLGLLGMAVIFDIVNLFVDRRGLAIASYYMIAAGVLTGLLAAIFGLVDWLAIPSGTRAKRVGLWHAVGNVTIVVLFIVSWFIRRNTSYVPSTLVLVLEIVALGLALVTSWLGGELVDRLGVGVSDGAHLDAPSSLSGEPARGRAASASR